MRALDHEDGRDLLVLLGTLVVMTLLLRATVFHVLHILIDVETMWILSALVLLAARLVGKHMRLAARASRGDGARADAAYPRRGYRESR
jgi:hypothetical protein